MAKARASTIDAKIKTLAQIKKIIARHRRNGKKIAFTNGCFDILHYGHVKYLEEAKQTANLLVVGLNSDTSVRKIKGKSRPLNTERDRARVLAALSFVDYITIFSEETPLGLIKSLEPDVLIKGGDWDAARIVGADIVKASGGKTIVIPYQKGYSTTGLIEKIHSG